MTHTNTEILDLAAKIVAAKPDGYTYESPIASGACLYADPLTGVPSCFVGHIVAALEPEMYAELARIEGENEGYRDVCEEWKGQDLGFADFCHLNDRYDFTQEQVDALNEAQFKQDRGEPWSDCLALLQDSLIDETPGLTGSAE